MIGYVDLKNIHDLQTNQQQEQRKLVNKEAKVADGRDKIAIFQPVLHQTCLVQCNVIREPESRNAGIWNLEFCSCNPESHERLEKESKFHRQGIRNPVPGIRKNSAESRIQAIKRLPWISVGTKC